VGYRQVQRSKSRDSRRRPAPRRNRSGEAVLEVKAGIVELNPQLRGDRKMFKTLSKASVIAVTTVLVAGVAGSANAETQWQKNHPRREEVNARLKNQNKRINQGVNEGELTKAQASKLHREDNQIRQEERDMASQDGGHITKSEKKVLNQQENAVNKQIGKEESQWDKRHPRRDQVNDRLEHQDKRINQEVKQGELTQGQASKLHHEDNQILQEERDMAGQNGGHITKQEQKVLNHQENGVSKQIGQ
jgi:CRISPR/Cas system-associated endoribonuclease Cas2